MLFFILVVARITLLVIAFSILFVSGPKILLSWGDPAGVMAGTLVIAGAFVWLYKKGDSHQRSILRMLLVSLILGGDLGGQIFFFTYCLVENLVSHAWLEQQRATIVKREYYRRLNVVWEFSSIAPDHPVTRAYRQTLFQ